MCEWPQTLSGMFHDRHFGALLEENSLGFLAQDAPGRFPPMVGLPQAVPEQHLRVRAARFLGMQLGVNMFAPFFADFTLLLTFIIAVHVELLGVYTLPYFDLPPGSRWEAV